MWETHNEIDYLAENVEEKKNTNNVIKDMENERGLCIIRCIKENKARDLLWYSGVI